MIDFYLWANNRVRILVSTYCNLDCIYCHNEGAPKRLDEMSLELYDYIIGLMEYTNNYPDSITFTGGEPLISNNLEYFIDKIKHKIKHKTVITNGILLTENRLNSLIKAGVNKIRLGIDSFLQNKSRPSNIFPKNKFNAIDTIEYVKKSNLEFELNIVISNFNIDELGWIVNYCITNRISAKFFSLLKIGKYGEDTKRGIIYNDSLFSFDIFQGIIKSSSKNNNVIHSTYNNGIDHRFDFTDFVLRYCGYLCPSGMCYVTGTRIDPNGWVSACMERQGQNRINTTDPYPYAVDKINNSMKNRCASRV